MEIIRDKIFDEERALYGSRNRKIMDCTFDGPADGESALKESEAIQVINCDFRLRYPFWHVNNAQIENCTMTDTCRAALWYDRDIKIRQSHLLGIKAVRECENITIEGSKIDSMEFGWLSRGIRIKETELISEYPFFLSRDMKLEQFRLSGKYSFQYVENVEIRDSWLDTKDAFWHSKNVTLYDCVVKGEYLAWYSENLKLVRCRIIGTQPLCYVKGLILTDCTMEGCDLSFEYSDVQADIVGSIESVKNPLSGFINADHIEEIILDENRKGKTSCRIETKDKVPESVCLRCDKV